MTIRDFSFDDDVSESVATAPRPENAPVRQGLGSPAKRSVRKGEQEADQLTAPVRILCLDIVGFKRIRAVQIEVTPTGITVIGGGNAQGKSSCLDAVTCLLGGGKHIPDMPVHGDEPRSTIAATLEDADGRKYLVKRVINPDRSGGLEICREDGTTVSRAQEFLDAMKGVLWFDPLAFLRQPDREQAETLRRLVGLDFSGLDKDRQKLYEQRTIVGRDRDRAKGHAESLPYHEDAPEIEQTSSELAAQMGDAAKHNAEVAAKAAKLQDAKRYLAGLEEKRDAADQECRDIQAQIDQLTRRLEAKTAEGSEFRGKITEFMPKLEAFEANVNSSQPIDITEIAARLDDVEAVNRKVRENQQRARAFAEHDSFAAEWDRFTSAIAQIDAEKRRQLAEARMPVEGLGFDEEGVTVLYNGYPLAQASGAEQMRVAVATVMEMSGGLKTCLVDEGEKLDLKQLPLLERSVREAGGQVLMTRVSDGPECAIIIEDGAVRQAVAA